MTEFKKNLLLSLGVLIFCLLVAEIAVRILDPVKPTDRVEFEVDHDAYWRVRPNQHDPRPPAVTVNAQGFRADRDVGEKRPDQQRVFILGDSYTWGSGVSNEETYAAQLEDMSEGSLDVINGGTPGWGVFQFKARLSSWIAELAPDVVVVLVNTNDILRQPYPTQEEEDEFIRRAAFRNFVRRVSKLVTVSVRLIERYRLQSDNRQVANAVPLGQGNNVSPAAYDRLLMQDITRLAEMASLIEQHGARFILVSWPQRVPMTGAFLASMESFASQHGVTHIDLSPTLEKHSYDDYTLPNDHHPSALGHRLVAERLLEAIESPE